MPCHSEWSEESLKTLPTQAVFGPDNLTFRPKLQGFFASLKMTCSFRGEQQLLYEC